MVRVLVRGAIVRMLVGARWLDAARASGEACGG